MPTERVTISYPRCLPKWAKVNLAALLMALHCSITTFRVLRRLLKEVRPGDTVDFNYRVEVDIPGELIP